MNGSPTEEFPLEMGLRQGDPISPFFFFFFTGGRGSQCVDDVVGEWGIVAWLSC